MANGHGGRRPGSGRKPSIATIKTREVMSVLEKEGLSPIEVLLNVMRKYYAEEKWDKAAAVARDAAVYCHPRLSAVAIGTGEPPARLALVEEIVLGVTANGSNGAADHHAEDQAAPDAAGLPPQ